MMKIEPIVVSLLLICANIEGLRTFPMTMAASAPKRGGRNELSKPKNDYRSLSGIPTTGTYTTPNGKSYTSAFLGLQKMETEKQMKNGNEEIILFNVVPVPLREDLEAGILAAQGQKKNTWYIYIYLYVCTCPCLIHSRLYPVLTYISICICRSKGTITDRDGGFFDSLLTSIYIHIFIYQLNPNPNRYMYRSKGTITDRDGGFFDSLLTLPYFVHGPDHSNPHAKKKVYDFIHKGESGILLVNITNARMPIITSQQSQQSQQ
jgi:hypothetical protein